MDEEAVFTDPVQLTRILEKLDNPDWFVTTIPVKVWVEDNHLFGVIKRKKLIHGWRLHIDFGLIP